MKKFAHLVVLVLLFSHFFAFANFSSAQPAPGASPDATGTTSTGTNMTTGTTSQGTTTQQSTAGQPPAQPSRPSGTGGIGVSNTGLPSNLPRLGLQGVTNPVSAVERILLNYVITPIFMLAGGVAVIVIMYSAFQIITARGEEEGLSAAKTTLIWAFLGLGLVMLAYTIVSNLARIVLQVL